MNNNLDIAKLHYLINLMENTMSSNKFQTFLSMLESPFNDLSQNQKDIILGFLNLLNDLPLSDCSEEVRPFNGKLSNFEKNRIISAKSRLDLAKLKQEVFRIYLFRDDEYLGYKDLFKGTICEAIISPLPILKECLFTNANQIAIVHNHPSGNTESSENDRKTEGKLRKLLATQDIKLIEFYIVTDLSLPAGLEFFRDKKYDFYDILSSNRYKIESFSSLCRYLTLMDYSITQMANNDNELKLSFNNLRCYLNNYVYLNSKKELAFNDSTVSKSYLKEKVIQKIDLNNVRVLYLDYKNRYLAHTDIYHHNFYDKKNVNYFKDISQNPDFRKKVYDAIIHNSVIHNASNVLIFANLKENDWDTLTGMGNLFHDLNEEISKVLKVPIIDLVYSYKNSKSGEIEAKSYIEEFGDL